MSLLVVFLFHVILVPFVSADYRCICNYEVETRVYTDPNTDSKVIGYLYEFDCKPAGGVNPKGFFAVQFTHMLGYVDATQQISAQMCPGDAPIEDLLTTTMASTTTTKATTVHSTTNTPTTITTTVTTTSVTTTPTTIKTTPTTIKTTPTMIKTTPTTIKTTPTTIKTTPTTTVTTTKTTTTRPTTMRATTLSTEKVTTASTTKTTAKASTTVTETTTRETTTLPMSTITPKPVKVPEGHIELCPNVSKKDVNRNGGFLGQYGLYCYEYVPYHTQWKNAERHCNLVSNGNLVSIHMQEEQDFVLRFLKSHNHSDSVWIGLTDSNAEGTWEWSTGANVTFKSFQGISQHYTDKDHILYDCVVLQSDGQWVDLPCGVPTILGGGFGEAHAYVCQYDLTSKPPDVFSAGYLSQFIVG